MRNTERRYWKNGLDIRPGIGKYMNGKQRKTWYSFAFSLLGFGVLICSNPSIDVFKFTEKIKAKTKYFVKTRNWHGKKWVLSLLSISRKWGVCGADVGYMAEPDNDVKLYITTHNAGKAWSIWLYFMMLKPLSGGWTYLTRGNAQVDGAYKSIYL